MNLQDVFKKIELALTPEKVELASMTLADGTMVEAEVFEAGANAFLVDGEGNRVAVPVGEHKLEDGKILVVEEEGIIKEIKEAAMEEEPSVEVEIEAAEVSLLLEVYWLSSQRTQPSPAALLTLRFTHAPLRTIQYPVSVDTIAPSSIL